MSRCAVFIDGGYIGKLCQQHFSGARVDYRLFVDELTQGKDLLRAYYYDCPPYQSQNPTDEEKERFKRKDGFFRSLTRLDRFHVRKGKLAKCGIDQDTGLPIFQQKRVDILLGVDMVQLAARGQINEAILVAGDSDFVPAIDVVKNSGVLTTLWHGPRSRSHENTVHDELWDAFDQRHEITRELIDKVKK